MALLELIIVHCGPNMVTESTFEKLFNRVNQGQHAKRTYKSSCLGSTKQPTI